MQVMKREYILFCDVEHHALNLMRIQSIKLVYSQMNGYNQIILIKELLMMDNSLGSWRLKKTLEKIMQNIRKISI